MHVNLHGELLRALVPSSAVVAEILRRCTLQPGQPLPDLGDFTREELAEARAQADDLVQRMFLDEYLEPTPGRAPLAGESSSLQGLAGLRIQPDDEVPMSSFAAPPDPGATNGDTRAEFDTDAPEAFPAQPGLHLHPCYTALNGAMKGALRSLAHQCHGGPWSHAEIDRLSWEVMWFQHLEVPSLGEVYALMTPGPMQVAAYTRVPGTTSLTSTTLGALATLVRYLLKHPGCDYPAGCMGNLVRSAMARQTVPERGQNAWVEQLASHLFRQHFAAHET